MMNVVNILTDSKWGSGSCLKPSYFLVTIMPVLALIWILPLVWTTTFSLIKFNFLILFCILQQRFIQKWNTGWPKGQPNWGRPSSHQESYEEEPDLPKCLLIHHYLPVDSQSWLWWWSYWSTVKWKHIDSMVSCTFFFMSIILLTDIPPSTKT